MDYLPAIRFFRLSNGGVEFGEDGLRVGGVELLERDAAGDWAIRDIESLRLELSRRYGLSLDIAANRSGLEAVARALRGGETTRA